MLYMKSGPPHPFVYAADAEGAMHHCNALGCRPSDSLPLLIQSSNNEWNEIVATNRRETNKIEVKERHPRISLNKLVLVTGGAGFSRAIRGVLITCRSTRSTSGQNNGRAG